MSEHAVTTGLKTRTLVPTRRFVNPFSKWRKSLGGWVLNTSLSGFLPTGSLKPVI